MSDRIPFDEWAADEEAVFSGNGSIQDVESATEFVEELVDLGVDSAEVGVYDGESDGSLYLRVGDIQPGLVAAIVDSRPDECMVEDDGSIRVWWD
mgnify:CR=1 FL=1